MKTSYHFGLIGSEIGYSRSPSVFAAIFEEDGTDGRFDLLNINPGSFDAEFGRLLDSDVTGLSVTIPYKQRVIDRLDELDPAAEALNAVNSIAVGESLRGFNTDGYGFAYALTSHTEALRAGRAVIFGCGGGARAAAFSLANDFDMSEIVLVGRSLDTLERCHHELQAAIPEIAVSTVLSAEYGSYKQAPFAIAVNGTPLGGWNHPASSPLPTGFNWSDTALYYDLNYNEDNRVVNAARAAGVTALDGSIMLVAQAVRSYGLWTGREVEVEPVYQRIFGR